MMKTQTHTNTRANRKTKSNLEKINLSSEWCWVFSEQTRLQRNTKITLKSHAAVQLAIDTQGKQTATSNHYLASALDCDDCGPSRARLRANTEVNLVTADFKVTRGAAASVLGLPSPSSAAMAILFAMYRSRCPGSRNFLEGPATAGRTTPSMVLYDTSSAHTT